MKSNKEYLKIYALASLIFSYLFSVDKTTRLKKINYNTAKTPAIYAVWHGRQYALLSLSFRYNTHILVSKSNDGESISISSKLLGFKTLRGSTNRGGAEALRASLKILKSGQNVAFTVDGPRGPIHKVKEGIIKMAQISGVPIIPIMVASKRNFNFKSWDKYQIPQPFSRVTAVYGDPIYIPRKLTDAEVENYRLQLENKLFELHDQAENCFKI